ncbi:hypothetical protein HK097_004122, partial [Rhizophlyctis rosea]
MLGGVPDLYSTTWDDGLFSETHAYQSIHPGSDGDTTTSNEHSPNHSLSPFAGSAQLGHCGDELGAPFVDAFNWTMSSDDFVIASEVVAGVHGQQQQGMLQVGGHLTTPPPSGESSPKGGDGQKRVVVVDEKKKFDDHAEVEYSWPSVLSANYIAHSEPAMQQNNNNGSSDGMD